MYNHNYMSKTNNLFARHNRDGYLDKTMQTIIKSQGILL